MLATALLPAVLASAPASAAAPLDPALAERFARLALACVHQEYPNKIAPVMASDADARPPRELTPAFYGCYDWHSSVHGHWLLARVARLGPDTPLAADARGALARSLTAANLAGEVRYLEGKGRVSFERPYGLAWLLQLGAELRGWGSPEARAWAASLAPLEKAAAARLRDWLPKLTRPIRIGEHSQTALALGLVLDGARAAGDAETAALVVSRSRDFYGADRGCPLAYEPSGEDFLSPCLVVIAGSGFDPDPTKNTVTFNGIIAGASSSSLTSTTVVVPDGVGVGFVNVQLTSHGTPSGTALFDVLIPLLNPQDNIIAGASTGSRPQDAEITHDGTYAYITNFGSNTVSVIGLASSTPTVGQPIPVGRNPYKIAIAPDGAYAFVTNYNSNTVSVIEIQSNTVIATIPVGMNPMGIAVTPENDPMRGGQVPADRVERFDRITVLQAETCHDANALRLNKYLPLRTLY